MAALARITLPLCLLAAGVAAAQTAKPIGQIKTASGAVSIERSGRVAPTAVGARVFAADVLMTGPHSSAGVTFEDNSRVSLGPSTHLSLAQFQFDPTTRQGSFDLALKRGTLAVKSGLIVQQTPEAMRVRTPAALLGVRGTEFVVSADGEGQ